MSPLFRKVLFMLRLCLCLLLFGVAPTTSAEEVSGSRGWVKKVLPHLVDVEGRHTVSPSLFDRDAYQAYLRQHPEEVGGIRYDIRWKAFLAEGRTVTLRVELRGDRVEESPSTAVLEAAVSGKERLRRWTTLTLTGADYARLGRVSAWRVSLWCDGEILDEYRSFLW